MMSYVASRHIYLRYMLPPLIFLRAVLPLCHIYLRAMLPHPRHVFPELHTSLARYPGLYCQPAVFIKFILPVSLIPKGYVASPPCSPGYVASPPYLFELYCLLPILLELCCVPSNFPTAMLPFSFELCYLSAIYVRFMLPSRHFRSSYVAFPPFSCELCKIPPSILEHVSKNKCSPERCPCPKMAVPQDYVSQDNCSPRLCKLYLFLMLCPYITHPRAM